MRNLVIHDQISCLLGTNEIVAHDKNSINSHLFLLANSGILFACNSDDLSEAFKPTDLNVEGIISTRWFNTTVIIETNSVVSISHDGAIVCGHLDGNSLSDITVEGEVDNGIACAQWNPDCTLLVIFTNNNTILYMTPYFDVIRETTHQHGLPLSLSWRGDGSYFSLLTTDESNFNRVHFYTKDGEYTGIGRNVADGVGARVQGVGNCVSYAPNGSLIAIPLSKTATRKQIAFFEPNGLRHGEFDIQLPDTSSKLVVDTIHWDVTSSILAITLSPLITDSETSISTTETVITQYIQFYIRSNYKWYLKQQISGPHIKCIGFDSEVFGRVYITQSLPSPSTGTPSVSRVELSNKMCVRMMDLIWDTCLSDTSDGTVAVIDGTTAMLSPLGISIIPPPMCAYKIILPQPCIASAFSKACKCNICLHNMKEKSDLIIPTNDTTSATATVTDTTSAVNNTITSQGVASSSLENWIFVAICDKAMLTLTYGDRVGKPVDKVHNIPVIPILQSILQLDTMDYSTLTLKSIAVNVPSCSSVANIAITVKDHTLTSYTQFEEYNGCGYINGILTLQVNIYNGNVISSHFHFTTESIDRVVTCPFSCNLIGYSGHTSYGYQIQLMHMKLPPNHNNRNNRDTNDTLEKSIQQYSMMELVGDGVHLSEICHQFTLLSDNILNEDKHMNIVSYNRPDNYHIQSSVTEHIHAQNDDVNTVDIQIPNWTVVALSSKNRLYCGEVLLMAGASSYTINTKLGVLTYITVGTRPALHYISIEALLGLSYLHGQHLEEQYYLECGEPRPVERGAKLVISTPGEPRVVIQLPRGNLEAFEPRPLILMKARILLDKFQIYDCLSLLRRQKIDLNYIVDYNPKLFFTQISSFVRTTLEKNAEYLSLFISALEPGNNSIYKYPIAIVGKATTDTTTATTTDADAEVNKTETMKSSEYIIEGQLLWKDILGQGKVNQVCHYIRLELLSLLHQGHSLALNPMLCAYAKPKPGLLEEALTCIATHFITQHMKKVTAITTATTTATNKQIQSSTEKVSTDIDISHIDSKTRTTVLASNKVQAAIKYLAFLVDGTNLFNTAVGQYDFMMARAVARQCQMDPKVYIPLLEKFESILIMPSLSSSPVPTLISSSSTAVIDPAAVSDIHVHAVSVQDRDNTYYYDIKSCLMKYQVNLHLNRHILTIEWGIKYTHSLLTLLQYYLSTTTNTTTTSNTTTTTITTTILPLNDDDNEVSRDRGYGLKTEIDRNNSILDTVYKLVQDHHYELFTIKQIEPIISVYTLLIKKTSSGNMSTDRSDDKIKSVMSSLLNQLDNLLRITRKSYGAYCVSKQLYDEAIVSYMAATPPYYNEAIQAAKYSANWQMTLILTGRLAMSENIDPMPKLKKVATEIVSTYRESIEQGDSDIPEYTSSVLPSYFIHRESESQTDGSLSSPNASTTEDRSLEASNISIEYCQDPESAIHILLTARKWLQAIQIALRYNRMDMLQEEIAPTLRDTCIEIIQLLPRIMSTQKDLVTQLSELWVNPTERLKLLQEADPESFKVQSKNNDELDEHQGGGGGTGDQQSEYSAISHLSRVSYVSHASVLSNQTSGTSSISILSELTLTHKDAHHSSNSHHKHGSDNFSITGIDHALLSRGKNEEMPTGGRLTKGGQIQRKVSDKRQRKWDRKKNTRGTFGQDEFQLKKEKILCSELYSLSHFQIIAIEVKNLCDALLLLNSKSHYNKSKFGTIFTEIPLFKNEIYHKMNTIEISDIILSSILQYIVDQLAEHYKLNPPPVAPAYPSHYLEKKQMNIVTKYQDLTITLMENVNTSGNITVTTDTGSQQNRATWWSTAAEGIIQWQSMRKLSLIV